MFVEPLILQNSERPALQFQQVTQQLASVELGQQFADKALHAQLGVQTAKPDKADKNYPAISSENKYPFILSDSQLKSIMDDPGEMLEKKNES